MHRVSIEGSGGGPELSADIQISCLRQRLLISQEEFCFVERTAKEM